MYLKSLKSTKRISKQKAKKMNNSFKICRVCGTELLGRPHKLYCNDKCRNDYNNAMNAKGNYSRYVRSVNNALLKNRRILISVLPPDSDMARITKDGLVKRGFQFKFSTHTHTTRTGRHFIYCYDLGYLALENDWYLVVKNESN